MKEHPKTTAKNLFESGLTVSQLEELQNHRRGRLDLWLDRRIQCIAEKEMELIAWGDEVLSELKKLYEKSR